MTSEFYLDDLNEINDLVNMNKNTKSLEDYLNSIQKLNEENKFQEAISLYKEALNFYQNESDLHFNLGILLKNFGHKEESLQYFENTINLNPLFKEAYFEKAIEMLEKSIE